MRCLGLLVSIAAIAACGPREAHLDPLKVNAMSVSAGGARICANDDFVDLDAAVTYGSGERLVTGPIGVKTNGALPRRELVWQSTLGSIDERGRLALPPNRLDWLERPIRVTGSLLRRREIAATVELTPRYDCGGALVFTGRDGGHGGEGEHGANGEPGHDLTVTLGYLRTARNGTLVLVKVEDHTAGELAYHVIDTRGAAHPFVIDASGGDGGDGGNGPDGSNGSDGSDGSSGSDGSGCASGENGGDGGDGSDGEDGGDGGDGGHGGNGGRIAIIYPRNAPELPKKLQMINRGGRGGIGGQGGSGGAGGNGGRGGAGGSAGSGEGCFASSGNSGSDGSDGTGGSSGRSGAGGGPGGVGLITARPVAPDGLFAAERKAGAPIDIAAGSAVASER